MERSGRGNDDFQTKGQSPGGRKGKNRATSAAAISTTPTINAAASSSSSPTDNIITIRREQNREYQQQYRKRKESYMTELKARADNLLNELEQQKVNSDRLIEEANQRNQLLQSIINAALISSRFGREAIQEAGQTLGLSLSDIEALVSTSATLRAEQESISNREKNPLLLQYTRAATAPAISRSSSSSGTTSVAPFSASPIDTTGLNTTSSPSWMPFPDQYNQLNQQGSFLSSAQSSESIDQGNSGNLSVLPWLDSLLLPPRQLQVEGQGDSSILTPSSSSSLSQNIYNSNSSQQHQQYHHHSTSSNAQLQEEMQSSITALETIERIHRYASFLRTRSVIIDSSTKDEDELLRVVEGLSKLVRQIEKYRRSTIMNASPSSNGLNPTLPSLLRPSRLQQVTLHDALIDAIPFSNLRQDIIQHQQSLPLEKVFITLIHCLSLGQASNPLIESSWHLNNDFYIAFPDLL